MMRARTHLPRPACGQPESDRATEILHVQRISAEAEGVDESLQHVRKVIKGVDKFARRRLGAVAKSRVVRCNQVIAVGQQRDEIPEHM
jgi:hypothetical protein